MSRQFIHPPSARKLVRGDVLTLDIGLFYNGFHTDHAITFVIGGEAAASKETNKFLKVGEETLAKAISQAGRSKYIGEISELIGREIYGNGYFILKELTGHGIGRDLHEDPFVPGFLDRPAAKTPKIQEGLALAIEIIYSQGTEKIKYERGSDWSIVTADGSLSACFEHTVIFTGGKVLTIT